MTTKQNIGNFVLSALEQHDIPAILLRGTGENLRVGGDIDVLVPASTSAEAALRVCEAAEAAGWSVIGCRHLGYVAQVCFLIPRFNNGVDISIKIDLSDGLSWYALGDDPIGEEIFRYCREGGDEIKTAALATFFQKALYPGYLRGKDIRRVFLAISSEEIHLFCVANGLVLSLEDIAKGSLGRRTQWHLRAASGGAGGLKKLPWILLVILSALKARLRFGTGSGIAIGVAGMDGSGKSTLVDRFVKAVIASEFTAPVVVHLLPDVIPTPHQIIKRRASVDNYTRPYSEPSVKSPINAALRLSYYILAFSAARLWCTAKTASGRMVVFDRSILDFASDLDRARIPHVRLPLFLLKLLLPAGFFFVLNAKPETVVARKGELTLERATTLSRRYLVIANSLSIACIDGDGDADKVFKDFVSIISAENMRRVRKWQK